MEFKDKIMVNYSGGVKWQHRDPTGMRFSVYNVLG